MSRSFPQIFPPSSQPPSVAVPVAPSDRADSPYDASFWKVFLANSLVSVGVAVLYRYADFITHLGGTELHLGWIVGIGMLGSLSVRLFVGSWIDRYGPRLVWLCALLLLACVFFGHLLVIRLPDARIQQPMVAVCCAGLRIAMWCAIAGVYASSMIFISNRVPVVRMAELLGMLGTSGFFGVIAGVWLSDLLLSGAAQSAAATGRMFLAAGCLSLAAFASAYWATKGQAYPVSRRRAPLWGLIRRYHPGRIMVMGVAMGFGLGLPSTFVRTYAAELDIPRIGWFFTVYAVTAILTRVVARRLPEQYGLRPVVLAGLGLVMVSQFLFLIVHSEWALMIPSVTYGIGHAILFPAGFAEGCCTFPPRYRGLGTSLMLATYDAGLLIGAPTAGLLVHFGQAMGWPGYPTMFLGVSILLALATGVYATAPREIKPRRARRGLRPDVVPAPAIGFRPPPPADLTTVTPASLPERVEADISSHIPTQGAA
ncbi:MAG: MFS transporter [Candidatus Anammoximicrobium sp.]|nr:MFS transporter [Candidatus Anammoximicrobium sp.]